MDTMIFPSDGVAKASEIALRDEENYRNQIRRAAEITTEKNARFLFLAGPSCSGKTTTSLALIEELKKRGKRVLTFSTDDFFFDGEKAPLNDDGIPNYDAFEHLDSALLLSVLLSLARGQDTTLPIFNFKTGKREAVGICVSPKDYDIFILEGIHALNDFFLTSMPPSVPYVSFYLDVKKKLVSQESGAELTPEERRFCRRLIRDFKHRFADGDRTYSLWRHVIDMEKIILHPFQKNALLTITTDFIYEIPVERDEGVAILTKIRTDSPWLEEAVALKEKLASFPSLSKDLVPENSVLWEFIG